MMHSVQKLAFFLLVLAVPSACTTSAPIAAPDAGPPDEDAPVVVGEDAPVLADDAGGCPVPSAGRWMIGTMTNTGPDCQPDDSIDLEFHPIAFTTGSDGSITSCECDRPTDACTPELAGTLGTFCENLLRCASGGSLRVYVTSPTTAEVREHELVSATGTCVASGPFDHE